MPGPERVAQRIGSDKEDILFLCTAGICAAGNNVAVVSGLLDRLAVIVARPAIGSGPERIALRIGFD